MLGAVISAAVVGWELRPGQNARGDEAGHPMLGQSQREEEPVGLGETGLTAPDESLKAAFGSGRLSRPVPQTPLKEQRRAPHSLPPVEATINGGCWVAVPEVKPPCGPPSYEWQGACYVPSFPRQRQPTSEPP